MPISELVKEIEPKTLSYIITDIKTRRLAGIKKETFGELLKAAGIPAKYFCRRNFANWDVLLPSEEMAVKVARSNITSKYRLQPKYMGRRRIKVTVCNVPIQLSGDVIAAFLTEYGDVEEVVKAKSTNGMAHDAFFFTMSSNRGRGLQAIPHTLEYENQSMMVVVEGRRS